MSNNNDILINIETSVNQTSDMTPSVVVYDGSPPFTSPFHELLIVWGGTNGGGLNLMATYDGGTKYDDHPQSILDQSGKQEQTKASPALAYLNGYYYLAWIGTNGWLNLNVTNILGKYPTPWFDPNKKNKYPTESGIGLALTVFQNHVYVAWTEPGGQIQVMHTTTDPTSFDLTTKTAVEGATSNASPSLTAGSLSGFPAPALYVSWLGGANLNVSSSPDGTSFPTSNIHTFSETTSANPTVASYNNQMYFGWTGNNQQINLMNVIGGDYTKTDKRLSSQQSPDGPALVEYDTGQTKILKVLWNGIHGPIWFGSALNIADFVGSFE